MQEKIYGCLAILKKEFSNEIVWRPVRADSEDSATKLFLALPDVVKLLLDGYQIKSCSACALGADFVPFNSGSDFYLLSNLDGKYEAVYIRVDGEYSEEFKKDFQALLSKYCPSLPKVFEE